MRRSRTRSASAVYTADGILVLMKITSFILPPYTPFRVYARKRCCSRNYFFFRATHEKGNFLPRLRLWAITKSKIPMQSIALRVRLACTTLTATPQMMRASFGEPQPLRLMHDGDRYFYKQTTPPDLSSVGAVDSGDIFLLTRRDF